jgi:large subunit ribosomal protein L25
VAENELVAEVREGAGKGAARKLRAAGRIPGVCYGRTLPSVGISLDPRELERLIAASTAGVNTLFQLRIAGVGDLDGKPVMVRELQRNPVNGLLLHADLYAVDLEQTIHVSVPIHITGTPAGVKMGGILDQALRTLDLECMPQAIPRGVSVEVDALEIGHTLHVRDLAIPEGTSLLSDPDLAVVSIVAPVAEEVPAEPEEEEVPEGEAAAAEAEEGEAAPEAQKPDEKESGEQR